MSDSKIAETSADEAEDSGLPTALGLFFLTFLSMLYMGCMWANADPFEHGLLSIWRGWPFAVPLMAILLSH